MSSNCQPLPVQRELQRSFPSVYSRQLSVGATGTSHSATTSSAYGRQLSVGATGTSHSATTSSVYGRQLSVAGATGTSHSATTSRPVVVPVSNSNPHRRAVSLVQSSTSLTVPVTYQRQTTLNSPCASLTLPAACVGLLDVSSVVSYTYLYIIVDIVKTL